MDERERERAVSEELAELFQAFCREIEENNPTMIVADTSMILYKPEFIRISYILDLTNERAVQLVKALERNTVVRELRIHVSFLRSNGLEPLRRFLRSTTRISRVSLACSSVFLTMRTTEVNYDPHVTELLLKDVKENSHVRELQIIREVYIDPPSQFVDTLSEFLVKATGMKKIRFDDNPRSTVNQSWKNKDGLALELHGIRTESLLERLLPTLHLKNMHLIKEVSLSDIRNSELIDDFLKIIASDLRCIKMNCGTITKSIAGTLRGCNSLKNLSLPGLNFEGMKRLPELIRSNTSIEELNISGNRIGNNEGILLKLAEVLYSHPSIQHLDMSRCKLGDIENAVILRDLLLHNQVLRVLKIGGNSFGRSDGAAAIRMIASGLSHQNARLEELDLSNCGLDNQDVSEIATCLARNKSLIALSLSNFQMGPPAVCSLAEMLRVNDTLKRLDLSHCNIQDEGAVHLARLLSYKGSSLTHLNISNATFGDDGLIALSSALETNMTLEALDMHVFRRMPYSDRGMLVLANSLPQLKRLKILKLPWKEVNEEMVSVFGEGLNQNHTLINTGFLEFLEYGFPERKEKLLFLKKWDSWSRNILFYQLRNQYAPLLEAADGSVPDGLWPHVIEQAFRRGQLSAVYNILQETLNLCLADNEYDSREGL